MDRRVLVGIIATFITAPASAGFIVDTGAGTGVEVALFNSVRSFQSLASEFETEAAQTVTAISAYTAFEHFDGTLTAVIMANDGSNIPGSTLHSIAFSAPAGSGWYGPTGLNWHLDAGSYWVGYIVETGQSFNGSIKAGAPNPLSRDIVKTPTLFWAERDYGFSWRIEGTPASTGAVPEPAAWALMIAGFGLVGAIARRRRAAAVVG